MKNVLVKAAAVMGVCVLSLTMSGCSGKSGDAAKSGGSSSSSATNGAEKTKMPTFKLDEVKKKWENLQFDGEKLQDRKVSEKSNQTNIQEAAKRATANGTYTPAECKDVFEGMFLIYGDTNNLDNTLTLGTAGGANKLGLLVFNAKPTEKDTSNIEHLLKTAGTCKEFKVEAKGVGKILDMTSNITPLKGFDSVAKNSVVVTLQPKGDNHPVTFTRVLLNNGQIIGVASSNPKGVEQMLKDALKALGVEVK